MNYDEFLHDLHFDMDKVRPVDLEVDWEDAPLPFKLYRGAKRIALPREIALELDTSHRPSNSEKPAYSDGPSHSARPSQTVSLREIGNLLWHSYGATQVSQTELASPDDANRVSEMQMIRRFVPSGGALYPSELYVYLNIDEVETGVYHYDAAHHQLVLLRNGEYDGYIRKALLLHPDISQCTAALFVACQFWKNFFKYHDFAYRLQGLDAGALIGQLLAVSKRLHFSSTVHFQFLDDALNHLLGLTTHDESVYAVIEIAGPRTGQSSDPAEAAQADQSSEPAHPARPDQPFDKDSPSFDADGLCETIPAIYHDYYMKSRRVSPYPTLVEMNQAALIRSFDASSRSDENAGRSVADPSQPDENASLNDDNRSGRKVNDTESLSTYPSTVQSILLPHDTGERLPFTSACRSRYSPSLDFRFVPLTLHQLASLLKDTMASYGYESDIKMQGERSTSEISLLLCAHGIEGLEDGAYEYNPTGHTLTFLRAGDYRMELQFTLSMPNVNLFEVPLCFHIVGTRDHRTSQYGYRGYRMEQMEAGVLLQCLLLSAGSNGMTGHPLLGYDAKLCDEIYEISGEGRTCLIQVPIGFAHGAPRLQGPLHG